MVNQTFEEYIGKRLSENTAKSYLYWYDKMVEEVGVLTEKSINNFFEAHPHEPVIGMISNLCKFYKFTKPEFDRRLIKKNPKIIKYLEDEKAENIISGFYTDYQLIPYLMFECGLRISEACGLRKNDIKYKEGRIIVVGKGNKARSIYPSPELLSALREHCSDSDDTSAYVFPSPKTGEAITPGAIRYHLRKVAESTHPHMFRHTFATNLIKKRIHLSTVQRAMGHSSPSTTSIYVSVFDEDLKKAFSSGWRETE